MRYRCSVFLNICSFRSEHTLPDAFHEQVNDLFNTYALVGDYFEALPARNTRPARWARLYAYVLTSSGKSFRLINLPFYYIISKPFPKYWVG